MKQKILVSVLIVTFLIATVTQAAGVKLWKDSGYTVDKVLMVSRHNIRTPLIADGSPARQLQPEGWFGWTVPQGDLSILGGQMETAMGQFYRRYLVAEGFMEEHWIPAPGQTRFYASSYQRTIATARYFGTGMLPVSDIQVEHKVDINKKDPVFLSSAPFDNLEFRQRVAAEIQEYTSSKGFKDNCNKSIAALNKALGLPKDNIKAFSLESFSATVNEKGIKYPVECRLAVGLADALVMQYYEEPDKVKAAFGHELTPEEWRDIGRTTDMSMKIHFGLPTMAYFQDRLLINEIKSELENQDRKFTFLCGHDTNIVPLMKVLEAQAEMPGIITANCPIGAKVIFQQLKGQDGQEYAALSLVYATPDQLRQRARLNMDNPPVISPITLKGLKQNKDGVYAMKDVQELLQRISDKADSQVK